MASSNGGGGTHKVATVLPPNPTAPGASAVGPAPSSPPPAPSSPAEGGGWVSGGGSGGIGSGGPGPSDAQLVAFLTDRLRAYEDLQLRHWTLEAEHRCADPPTRHNHNNDDT